MPMPARAVATGSVHPLPPSPHRQSHSEADKQSLTDPSLPHHVGLSSDPRTQLGVGMQAALAHWGNGFPRAFCHQALSRVVVQYQLAAEGLGINSPPPSWASNSPTAPQGLCSCLWSIRGWLLAQSKLARSWVRFPAAIPGPPLQQPAGSAPQNLFDIKPPSYNPQPPSAQPRPRSSPGDTSALPIRELEVAP